MEKQNRDECKKAESGSFLEVDMSMYPSRSFQVEGKASTLGRKRELAAQSNATVCHDPAHSYM